MLYMQIPLFIFSNNVLMLDKSEYQYALSI
jgi:hypothetical protein